MNMMTASIITTCFKNIVLALTPEQRWGAAAGKLGSSSATEQRFIIIGIVVLAALAVLFVIISFKRNRQQRITAGITFAEQARKKGLSEREQQLLIDMARKAGLKREDSIFTIAEAFDRGSTKMVDEKIADRLSQEERKRLKFELSFLREKLGLKKQQSLSTTSAAKQGGLSSTQIPIGKKVHITRRKVRGDVDDIESTVVENTDTELAIKLTRHVKITFGEFWRVRYYFGSSVWEFDSSVVSYDGSILVLNHSNDVRFINRRRFLRVPVRRSAFIAHFPFVSSIDAQIFGPPKFIPAVVTELAGPGLRIESKLEVETGQRILVVFDIDRDQSHQSNPDEQFYEAATSKIVGDIAKVRHTKVIKDGLSIAVELTGLSDFDIDELIRATNAASVNVNAKNLETAGVQGV